MPTALPLQNRISQSANETGFQKLTTYQLGDGYSSVVAEGVNNTRTEWSITWEALNASEYYTVKTFIDSVKGTGVISWTPPDYTSTKYFRIKPSSDKLWEKTFDSGEHKTLKIDLYEIVYTGV